MANQTQEQETEQQKRERELRERGNETPDQKKQREEKEEKERRERERTEHQKSGYVIDDREKNKSKLGEERKRESERIEKESSDALKKLLDGEKEIKDERIKGDENFEELIKRFGNMRTRFLEADQYSNNFNYPDIDEIREIKMRRYSRYSIIHDAIENLYKKDTNQLR